MFMNADFICTDSFHGTSFSILLESHLFVLNLKKSLDTRKTNLCKVAGLDRHIYYLDSSKDIYYGQINYDDVKRRIASIIEISKEYLYSVLE